jgi:hypothetical protein
MLLSRPLSTLVAAVVLALPLAAVPAAAAPTDSTPSGARYVELKAPQPDWYTPALHARVMAAAARGEGVPIPEGVDYDTSGLAFTGIRPGGLHHQLRRRLRQRLLHRHRRPLRQGR